MEFTNEYNVFVSTSKINDHCIIKLNAMLLGKDHLAFRLPNYEMTLRDYICDHRSPRQLGVIFFRIIKAL